MNQLVSQMAPELFLITVACFLFLLGVSAKAASRHASAVIAILALAGVFFYELIAAGSKSKSGFDPTNAFRYQFTRGSFNEYIRLIASGMGILLVLLAWPTNHTRTGSDSLEYGHDAGEFFGLMLLSISGILLAAGANDMILLFLGIELASIPTYIMVSISRPLPAAQEAGVKYFFLGAMAAAVMLFGFSYLYGTTGFTRFDQISGLLHPQSGDPFTPSHGAWLTTWQTMAVVMLLVGFCFKIAAVPLHAYAGDVYQGAATPVTAFLAFVPKTTGFIAILKVLSAVGGPHWAFDPIIIKLLWAIAFTTMCVGNVLALIPFNVKRVLAYSSVAHSGYMLVGVTALAQAAQFLPHDNIDQITEVQSLAVAGVLFYLAGYGIMNSGAFGVLMLLPSREAANAYHAHGEAARTGSTPTIDPLPATTAETFDDLAGQGRRHIAAGLAMSICCFSLIGIPLTVGFVGKVYLIQPALESGLVWLVIFTVVNALVSAGYYLKIVAAMFLRPLPETEYSAPSAPAAQRPLGHARHHFAPHGLAALAHAPMPLVTAILLSVVCTLLFGSYIPALNGLTSDAARAASVAPVEQPAPAAHPALAQK